MFHMTPDMLPSICSNSEVLGTVATGRLAGVPIAGETYKLILSDNCVRYNSMVCHESLDMPTPHKEWTYIQLHVPVLTGNWYLHAHRQLVTIVCDFRGCQAYGLTAARILFIPVQHTACLACGHAPVRLLR